jgi:hypothetical protein
MAEKRMACWNCPRYVRAERRCLDGKANPKKKAESVEVAETLGLRALCHYNLHRDGLALRRHFPTSRPAMLSVAPRRSRRDRRGAAEQPESAGVAGGPAAL